MSSRGTQSVSEHECRVLLREHSFGRIGVNIADDIVVLPVYYAVLDDEIVFRTEAGTKLSAGFLETRVAFEIDNENPPWSVLARGYAHEIRDSEDAEAARHEIPGDWPPGEREHIVRIHVHQITGRRLPDGD